MAKASQADAGREEIKALLDKMTYRPLGNVGTVDRAPWNGLSEKDVDQAIDAIRKENVRVISLSPHDSSDWCLERFRKAFQKGYVEPKVGKEIVL